MAGVITWIAVGGAVGYATCGRDARGVPSTWIADIVVGAASGFVGGGLAALFWNHASTRVGVLGVILAAATSAAVTVAARKTHVVEPDRP